MLRILVISLFVANLLLLGFQASKPDVETEAVAGPDLAEESNIPTIHLFSEMMQDENLMSGNRQCFSLGPFHTIAERDEILAQIENVTSSYDERQTQALVEKGYWVYLPPYSSLLEANRALLSLQALGLEDVAVIYNGEWKNAVSLGYFLRQKNAINRKKSLEKRGWEPLLRVQRQTETRYWLDYEQDPGAGLVSLNLNDSPNDTVHRSLPCPDKGLPEVAGPAQVPEEEITQLVVPEDNTDMLPAKNEDNGAETGSGVEVDGG